MNSVAPVFVEAQQELDTSIIDALPVSTLVCDRNGRICNYNSAFAALFGYDRQELIGKTVDVLLPAAVRSAHTDFMAKFIAQPEKRIMGQGRELFAMRKDGSLFAIEIGLNPITTTTGMQVLATVVDLSAYRAMEQNILRIIEAAPVGMLVINAAGNIAVTNRKLLQTFGYSAEELRGQPLETLVPERFRMSHHGYRQNFQKNPATRDMGLNRDLTGLHKSGSEFPVEIGLNHLVTDSGKHIVATVVDITERKVAELRLKQINADLDEFTYVASHDLKSPLRGINSLIEWIEEDLGSDMPEPVRNNLERVHLRIARMEKLMEDLLSFARSSRSANDYKSFKVADLVADVRSIVDLPPGFTVDVSGELGEIFTNYTPLSTVLRNLVSNAINHHDQQRGNIAIDVRYEGSFASICVSDDGPGIPSAAHGRIFKLFQSLNNADKSRSGVGLAVCKRLVQAHGGNIEVITEDGKRGCCFRFSWPRFPRRDFNAQ